MREHMNLRHQLLPIIRRKRQPLMPEGDVTVVVPAKPVTVAVPVIAEAATTKPEVAKQVAAEE